ncbi:Putative acetate transporter GPR1/FUN34/SatP family [Septoria linicola]|uniref:Acetate transporter GPR1/FUN34/SatP family n=1 Tax=Septoria linicola TaxID=215465 RepID=A0A9Q9BAP8_9PEZI|nr:Putative acetate transporter GPR1/FUN34/SatP family [Septoria linicola]
MSDAKQLEDGQFGSEMPEDSRNGAKHYEQADFGDAEHDTAGLRKILTSKSITDEQFERLFLSPRNVKASPLKGFANPTPLAIMGFSVGLTPLSAALLGWRGAGGAAQSSVGATIWFGGLLLWLAGLGEFILGNTFPFLVFMGYGAHFLTFGTTFMPMFNAVSAYTSGNPYIGEMNQEQTAAFANSYGFYPLSLGILSFIFLLCSLRTNLIFFLIFVAATMGFGFATASFFYAGIGAMAQSSQFLVATGACFWAAAMLGWYLLLAIMIPTMELPFPELPVVDLASRVRAKEVKVKV